MGLWTVREDGKWWNGDTSFGGDGIVGRPTADNTGWAAAGATLTDGDLDGGTLLGTQTIDSKTYVGHFQVGASANIFFSRCQINGRLDCDGGARTLRIEDCNINASTVDAPAVGYGDFIIRRSNIIGGANSVIGGDNVLIEDSWLHSQYLGPTAESHENAFISNGGNGITIRNCVLHADQPDNGFGGGVSTNCSLFGDFSVIQNVLIENCLIKATPGAYGVSLGYNPAKPFGSNPTNVIFRNNVFERGPSGLCGVVGPVTGFLDANGNQFVNNTWEDDGTPVIPA